MGEHLDRMKKKIDEFFNSEEGNAYAENQRKKADIEFKRFERFEEWLKHNDFDILLYRLILKHDNEYREKCYHKGYEPKPNNILEFIFDYLDYKFDTIKVPEIDCDFYNEIWFFRGYLFQIIQGQGCIYKIYNKKDMRILLTV